MKRTTLILEEACIYKVRELAHRDGQTMSKIVNDLLAEGLRRRQKQAPQSFEIPSYDLGQPKVNLADRDALEARMDS